MADTNTRRNIERQEQQVALKLHNISKIYPGTVALQKVNLEVKRGEVHGIIGKNGAGKSTLVGIIAGIESPTAGDIFIGDRKYASLSRITAKKEKISIVPQEPQVILDFTVAENLFFGDYTRGKLINWKDIYHRAENIIQEVNLNLNVRAKAGDLSISEQQLLLVLKACYVENARVIILDEASASLSVDDEQFLYDIIQKRKKEGNTIIFISHRTDELLKVCDRVTVIRDGRSVATKNCSELNKESLSALIVGEDFKFSALADKDRKNSESAEIVLSVEKLTRAGVYKNINFVLRKGEILGLAGLRGSGRTEILKGIVGIDPADDGWVQCGGANRRFTAPSQAFKNGIVYLPEDREKEGLINPLSVRENLILNSMRRVCRGMLVHTKKERQFIANLIYDLTIKIASYEQEVNQLSGGNKQKVVVGRIASARPKVLLLDEPTRGVDISAKDSILKIIKHKLSESAGIVITSPGIEELIQVCDRILILHKGTITGEFQREDFVEGQLYLAVQGHEKNENTSLMAKGE